MTGRQLRRSRSEYQTVNDLGVFSPPCSLILAISFFLSGAQMNISRNPNHLERSKIFSSNREMLMRRENNQQHRKQWNQLVRFKQAESIGE